LTPALIAVGLEAALQAAGRLDPDTQLRLAALAGTVIAIEVEGFGLIVYLHFAPSGVRVLELSAEEPTVRIRGTPPALFRQWRGQGTGSDAVTLVGDAVVGREFQALLAGIDLDWEEQAAHWLGDGVAHQLGRFWRGFQAWGHSASRSLHRDGGEYLQYELRLAPPRPEIEQFLNAVDRVREDADRLSARLERLRRRLTADDPH